MAKVNDIVRLDKMASEHVGALSYVTGIAQTELQNGRIVSVDASDNVNYSADGAGEVFLHASVEFNPQSPMLTDFKVSAGNAVRLFRFLKGDKFATSAIADGLVKGDAVVVSTGGTLIKKTTETPDNEFEFVAYDYIGDIKVGVVKVSLVK